MSQNADVLKRFLAAETERDLEAMAECLHEGFILHVVGANELIHGKANFLSVIRTVFSELRGWDLGVGRIIGDGETIAVEFNGSGHFTGDFEGERFENIPLRIASICTFDFEDGLIKHCAEYYDSQSLKSQLRAGASPAAPQVDR